jgi:uncharacterized protein YndB with AHSA1/START domain
LATYTTTIDIAAPPEIVFAHLTTVDGVLAWMGQAAQLEPVRGGRFAVDIDGSAIRGEFVAVDPPHRMVVTWGVEGSDTFPPGASTVEFHLSGSGDGTQLRLIHSGLPDERLSRHAQGWQHFLGRLRVTVGISGMAGQS